LPASTESVELDSIVRKAYDMFLGVAEAARVDLRIVALDRVRVAGDAGRLRQVINNLIDNAIKFTRAEGFVEIRLEYRSAERIVRFSVRDNGSGIPAADLPHIFDRFYRGDKVRQRERRSRGTGLGLAICQSIVTANQGRIEVESVVDQGTTFTVILPAAGATDSESPATRTEPALSR
jgi:signal transduction histidine kinase